MEDIVRVLRVIEYVGPRDKIEKQLANSLHGPRDCGNGVTIRAATIGSYPEILIHHVAIETAVTKAALDSISAEEAEHGS
jgi:hypothetical protein